MLGGVLQTMSVIEFAAGGIMVNGAENRRQGGKIRENRI